MHVSGTRRRGPLVLSGLAAVLLAASTGLTASAKPQQADPLQRQVDAIHDTGAVGVFAEATSPHTRDSARAGTAERGTGRPMPQNGRFRIGSTTKTFTATVVLQLVGEGRMSLEDTVEQWLPGVVRGNGNDGGRITVRQLLQHTSGIPDVKPDIPALNSADGYRAERFRTYTAEKLVRLAMRHPPNFPPGTDWSYSNTNYILAAMIIHEVTGRSWAQEVNDRIIRPLGLRDTSTPGTFPAILGPHAHGYAAFSTDTSIDVTTLNPSMAVGSGSIISTAHDLNRFYTALLGGRLLAPAQLDEMTTTKPAPELGVRYGLGLGEIPLSCGGSYFGHLGELLGYHAWGGATRDGTRTAVVYVTSDGGQDTQQAMTTLVDRELCRTRS
ncbi:serine hydrolase domain-containing protein [Streptomyces rapamycinicus]|uniref:Beta-lactamase class C and other penicillinbinding protein-like protein n=1 Tax=Streptomyces rapamycinicus (strain ATCC 29253 / DSM 41530 / NRRL 5491 / AYB-994) TaxID=1343740 RepID=A0A3L8R845_STRRN|nr:serine hydrolase domain-containing protein [Streptomyces rapamycinicus]RLV75826.1 Beta-lactamase class C and other penicillinbinding protein-like protein [Streptomyces rapamycinicus NRRL 5491]UTP28280.1 beta-lactamase family protein [Streptomyces rapamycinicus NRRL 5491]